MNPSDFSLHKDKQYKEKEKSIDKRMNNNQHLTFHFTYLNFIYSLDFLNNV